MCSPHLKTHAFLQPREYENFIVDLEFKNEKGTNSGVIVYCTDRKDWIPNSVEVQIADDFYFMEEGLGAKLDVWWCFWSPPSNIYIGEEGRRMESHECSL